MITFFQSNFIHEKNHPAPTLELYFCAKTKGGGTNNIRRCALMSAKSFEFFRTHKIKAAQRELKNARTQAKNKFEKRAAACLCVECIIIFDRGMPAAAYIPGRQVKFLLRPKGGSRFNICAIKMRPF